MHETATTTFTKYEQRLHIKVATFLQSKQSQMRCLKTDSHFSIAYKILPHLKLFGITSTEKQRNTQLVSLSLCDSRPLNCKKKTSLQMKW